MRRAYLMVGAMFSRHRHCLRCISERNILESGSVMSDHTTKPSIWRDAAFALTWALQGFPAWPWRCSNCCSSWILIGILGIARRSGRADSGGHWPARRFVDARRRSQCRSQRCRQMLIRIYLVAPIFPLFLVLMEQWQLLGVASVITWGLGMTVVQSYSMPGQQALLNRIAGQNIQQG